jgi:hypothetical protein
MASNTRGFGDRLLNVRGGQVLSLLAFCFPPVSRLHDSRSPWVVGGVRTFDRHDSRRCIFWLLAFVRLEWWRDATTGLPRGGYWLGLLPIRIGEWWFFCGCFFDSNTGEAASRLGPWFFSAHFGRLSAICLRVWILGDRRVLRFVERASRLVQSKNISIDRKVGGWAERRCYAGRDEK